MLQTSTAVRSARGTGRPISRRALILGSTALAGGALLSLSGCQDSESPSAETSASSDPLPAAQPDPESQFGVDANINMGTIDNYLFRDDVAYRDMRLFDDPADYEAIGGNSKLSMAIKGFTVVPYPYLGTLAALPVSGAYDGQRLFEVTWGEGLEMLGATPTTHNLCRFWRSSSRRTAPSSLCAAARDMPP